MRNLAIIAILALASASFAQTAPVSQERLELAHRLFDTGDMAAQMRERLETVMLAGPAFRNNAAASVVFERHLPDFLRIQEHVYAEVYSADELRGLIAFNRTPLGQAVMRKTPELTRLDLRETLPLIMEMNAEMARSACAPPQCVACTRQPCPPPPPMRIPPVDSARRPGAG